MRFSVQPLNWEWAGKGNEDCVRLIWSYNPGLGTSHITPNQRGPGLEWENRPAKSDCIKAASINRATDTHKAKGSSTDEFLVMRSPSLTERRN